MLVVLVLRVVLVALVVSFLLGFLLLLAGAPDLGRVRPSLYWRLTPWLLQPRRAAASARQEGPAAAQ